jgi:hypothetical protein
MAGRKKQEKKQLRKLAKRGRRLAAIAAEHEPADLGAVGPRRGMPRVTMPVTTAEDEADFLDTLGEALSELVASGYRGEVNIAYHRADGEPWAWSADLADEGVEWVVPGPPH